MTGELCALGLLLVGFRPAVFFRAPMVLSTSPVDFWSRRWNLLVKRLFHRTIFLPLRQRRAPGALCALAAFVVSGLFHEYAFMAASGGRAFGSNLLFFVSQGVICSLEVALGALGLRLPAWLREATYLRAALTTLCLVPFSPLFMAPLRVGEPVPVLEQMSGTLPHVRLTLSA